jgi:osmotically inducible lipoprotein OsmB
MMFAIIRVVFAMGLVLISSGCGQNTKTPATTGGVVGTGGGIALGVATGGIGPAVGALVGGGVGAAGGAATSERSKQAIRRNLVAPPQGVRQPIVNAYQAD